MKIKRILYLSGLGRPASIPFQEKLLHLSNDFSGDMIFAVSKGGKNSDLKEIGNFWLHQYDYIKESTIARNLYTFWMSLYCALKIFYSGRRYEVIVSSTPFVTGLAAILLSRLTKAKAVIEINGNFESAYKYDSKDGFGGRLLMRIKDKVSRSWISFVVRKADGVKLVYDRQLEPLGIHATDVKKVFSFANFVPIRRFMEAEKSDRGYVLLLGYPWYLKGVDILIKAFKKISTEFPDLRLKVVGWCPSGREYFEGLADGDSRIELNDPPDDPVHPVCSRLTHRLVAAGSEGGDGRREARHSRRHRRRSGNHKGWVQRAAVSEGKRGRSRGQNEEGPVES
jgi:glycosyltransferase involved in cell wall biosynthesis